MSSLAEDLAYALHEEWRKTRLKADGSYEPRWKKIKDDNYIKDLNKKDLPSYVRKNEEGIWEIDIANAGYTQLSADWQAENKAAAEVVAQIIESGKNYSREEIGDIIHNAWLERNSWAKDDPVLGLPFAKLPKEEQDKDLVQYDTGLLMAQATKVTIYVGNLDNAAKFLKDMKSRNGNVYIDFNGRKLYSQFDNLDSCYVKVCGRNKAEQDLAEKRWHENFKRRQALEEAKAAKKVPEWQERGYAIIHEELKSEWNKCIEARVNDIYHGAELENALQIMECLAKGEPVEKAIKIAESANHSGASWGMMMSIVTNFSKRGTEFYRANYKELNIKDEKYLYEIETRNALLDAGYSLNQIAEKEKEIKADKSAKSKMLVTNTESLLDADINILLNDQYNLIAKHRKEDWDKKCEKAFNEKEIGAGKLSLQSAYCYLAMLNNKNILPDDIFDSMYDKVDQNYGIASVLCDMIKYGDERAIKFAKEYFPTRINYKFIERIENENAAEAKKNNETFGGQD